MTNTAQLIKGTNQGKSQRAPVEDRWLTVREAAAILRVHPISIYRGCSAHRIPHVKAFGIRIDRADLERFMQGAKIPARRRAKF